MMSWVKISMKFPGTCIVCSEKINTNEVGLWSKGTGVKHETCAGTDELKCIICGGPAGCADCEFRDMCDIVNVSQLCICKGCSEERSDLESYKKAVGKKFQILNTPSRIER